jgi:lipopolysaccharide export system protein LptA
LARLVLALSLTIAFALFSRLSWAQDRSTLYFPDSWEQVDIHADSLSVSDRNQTATFSGHVVVMRGALRTECARLLVHYHSEGTRHGVIDRFECKPDYMRE